MSDGDFIREVNEAVRQEEMKRLWNRYGILMLCGAVLIVAVVAGYKGWGYWQEKQAAEAGARFVGALTLKEDGENQDAVTAFRELSSDGPAGYRVLAKFQLAAASVKSGKTADAVKLYDELAATSGADAVLQGFASIQAAMLRVDEAPFDEIKQRVGSLAEGTGPWRHSAREVLGLAAYRAGDNSEAERLFSRALVDPGIPANMRRRAEMMLALIVKADAPPAPKTN